MPGTGRLIGRVALFAAVCSGCAGLYSVPDHETLVETIGDHDTPLGATRVRVVVWNTYKGKRRRWASDFARLSQGRDLVLIQEAYLSPDGRRVYEAREHLRWTVAASFAFERRGRIVTGVATGSRDGPTAAIPLRSPGREPITGTPKMALATIHEMAGAIELMVVNVHGINFARYAEFDRQLDAVEAFMEAHNGPILLAGDFNTRTRRRTDRLARLARTLDLTAVEFLPDRRMRAASHPLDHAFVRGLEVSNASIPPLRSSDHRPLVFDLRLGATSGP